LLAAHAFVYLPDVHYQTLAVQAPGMAKNQQAKYILFNPIYIITLIYNNVFTYTPVRLA